MSRRENAQGSTTATGASRPVLKVPQQPGETPADAVARAALRPSVGAALTVANFTVMGRGTVELPALVDELARQSEQVNKGDMGRAEAMLMAQAHALDALFHGLVQRSALNMGEYLDAAEKFMRLALKAQSQCRATLETLGALKNPPVVYARQANIANGPQQVNNGTGPDPRMREIENEPNKLLEARDGQRLDARTEGTAIGGDPAMEAMGTIDRTKN